MLKISEVIGLIALIIIGLNLTANNALVSILVTYMFYRDKTAGLILRFSGAIMALSSILIITGMTNYAIYANIIILLILTFFSIRGRTKAFKANMSAREKLLKEYESEIKLKKERVQELRTKILHKDDDDSPFGIEGQSVDTIKKKMWNDGKMTSKDLISGLKDDTK